MLSVENGIMAAKTLKTEKQKRQSIEMKEKCIIPPTTTRIVYNYGLYVLYVFFVHFVSLCA